MTDETFKKIIKDGKELGVTHYSPFMSGEPFVFPKIWEWLDYMEKEGVWVSLYTNGEFLDVDRLVKYKNIRYVNCSVNAATKRTHKAVVRGPDFDRVVDNVNELFKKAKFMVRASFIRCEENAHEEEAFKKMFPRVKIGDYDNWTGDRSSEYERKGERIPCYVLLRQMFILWNGDVVPCCMDYDGKMVLGNVHENSLKEIREYSKWLINKHKNGDFDTFICRKCNYNVKN